MTSAGPEGATLSVALPGLEGVDDALLADDGTVVYSSDDDVSIAVQPLESGATRFLTVLDEPTAPTEYEYEFAGSALELLDDGSVIVSRDGEATGRIDAPWAYDANNKSVATHYE